MLYFNLKCTYVWVIARLSLVVWVNYMCGIIVAYILYSVALYHILI